MIGGMVIRVEPVRGVGLFLALALVAAACTTEPAATTATMAATTTTSSTTSSTVPETTSTTSMEQRISEVTEIVREVDFGWFDAIYRKDETALMDVVAVQENYDIGVELMSDTSFFVGEPTFEATLAAVHEILIDRKDCLAVSYFGDATAFRGGEGAAETIVSFWPRPSDGRWRVAYRGSLWEDACNIFARENHLP